MTTEADVGKAAPLVIAAAAAACAPAFGVGAPICAAGAAIATALTAAGLAVSSSLRDTFGGDAKWAESMLTTLRVSPQIATDGDIDGITDPAIAARLGRYLRVLSGEVPTGSQGNTGALVNPKDTSCANPYLCAVDNAEPLTDPAYHAKVKAGYAAWSKAGAPGKLANGAEALPHYVPSDRPHPQDAATILLAMRSYPDAFRAIAGGEAFVKRANEIRAQLRALRASAGEAGPDPVLAGLWGGDVTPPARDPKVAGITPPDSAPPSAPLITPGRVALFALVAGTVAGLWHLSSKKNR